MNLSAVVITPVRIDVGALAIFCRFLLITPIFCPIVAAWAICSINGASGSTPSGYPWLEPPENRLITFPIIPLLESNSVCLLDFIVWLPISFILDSI